jgi:di/tricarboxylate transporter
MTPQIAILLSILLAAIILMATERLRADVVALLVTIALTLTGVILPDGHRRLQVQRLVACWRVVDGLAVCRRARIFAHLLAAQAITQRLSQCEPVQHIKLSWAFDSG